MEESLFENLERVLADHCSHTQVLTIEDGGDFGDLWRRIDELGYADAFVPDERGGIGLPMTEAFSFGFTLGHAGCPLPVQETAFARALIASARLEVPVGPIALCDGIWLDDRTISLPHTSGLRCAGHVLVQLSGNWHLFAVDSAQVLPGYYRPKLSGRMESLPLTRAMFHFPARQSAARYCAALQAADMAGAMTAILDLTLSYAGQRRQFGRAISQFQAIQQELSVMAEQVAYANTAARLGCHGSVIAPDGTRGASAKAAACEAAQKVVAVGHAVHGAIGISNEYALGIYVRRLQEAMSVGATWTRCVRDLGSTLLQGPSSMFDFVRESLPSA